MGVALWKGKPKMKERFKVALALLKKKLSDQVDMKVIDVKEYFSKKDGKTMLRLYGVKAKEKDGTVEISGFNDWIDADDFVYDIEKAVRCEAVKEEKKGKSCKVHVKSVN